MMMVVGNERESAWYREMLIDTVAGDQANELQLATIKNGNHYY
jgi:hypothetical protein